MLSLLAVIISNHGTFAQTNAEKYCPGNDWIFCAKEETVVQTCSIPANIGQATVSYGVNDGSDTAFSFYDISSFDSVDYSFEFGCSDGRLGNPVSGKTKGCCVRKGPISYNYSTYSGDWEFKGIYDTTWNTNGIRLVKYQMYGSSQSFYRWMDGEVACNEDYFPYWEPYGQSSSAQKSNTCYQYNPKDQNYSDYTPSGFVWCGDSGKTCSSNVVQMSQSMSLVSFGSGSNGVYTWAYSADAEIQCDKSMFLGYNGEYCYIQNQTLFIAGEVLGNWVNVDSCNGCSKLQYSLTEGTTSQSKQAGTSSWVKALGDVVSAGIRFLDIPLSSAISGAISDLVQPSYTYTTTQSHTCSVECGNGTEADWHIYQWVMNAQEYINMDTSPFNISACQYTCNTEPIPPKCPPGYCVDFACQTCTSSY